MNLFLKIAPTVTQTEMKKVFGIIGYPLAHSFSNKYFTAKFEKEQLQNCMHAVFPLKNIEEFTQLIESQKQLVGLNVTIPYKESILPFLDELDTTASAVGAVNTVKIIRNETGTAKKLIGYNTDVYGFKNALKPFLKNNHQRALILGTGGAAKAVAFVLKQLGIDFSFVSRNPSTSLLQSHATIFSYDELNENHLRAFHLLINCSPVGMSPNQLSFPPLPYSQIGPEHLLFDLVYNPDVTQFLSKGKERGALTQNGLTMLYLQAEESWKIWNA